MPVFILALLKRIALSLVFDYLYEQLLKFVAEKVKETDNNYDDELVEWFSGFKDEVKEAAKTALKGK